MNKGVKNLDYYLNLKYDIIVREIEDPDGTFYQAITEELDPIAFYGVGDTPEQAIECFKETQKALFIDHLENRLPIPEPEPRVDDFYSGKFIVRTSPATHRKLARMAKKNKRSLNSQINAIFIAHLTTDGILEVAKKELMEVRKTQFEKRSHQDGVYKFPNAWSGQSEGAQTGS